DVQMPDHHIVELTPCEQEQGPAPDARRFESHQQRKQHIRPKDRGAAGAESRHSDVDRGRNDDPADQRQPQAMPDKPQRAENGSPEMKSVADECQPFDNGDPRTVRYRSMNCVDRHRYSPPRTQGFSRRADPWWMALRPRRVDRSRPPRAAPS